MIHGGIPHSDLRKSATNKLNGSFRMKLRPEYHKPRWMSAAFHSGAQSVKVPGAANTGKPVGRNNLCLLKACFEFGDRVSQSV